MTQVNTRIVGAQHYEGAQTQLNVLRRGTRIELVREPDNRHDANAVSCWYGGQQLGHIPRKDNPPIAAAMDRGDPVTCEIAANQPMVRVSWPSAITIAEGQPYRRIVRG
jgi:hypothetical protein